MNPAIVYILNCYIILYKDKCMQLSHFNNILSFRYVHACSDVSWDGVFTHRYSCSLDPHTLD